jgi:7-keto-8-aminopelargonate synthetase-like enzyme
MDRIAEELEKLRQKEQLRTIPNVESKSDGRIVVDGVEYVNFASNDYLGLSTKEILRNREQLCDYSIANTEDIKVIEDVTPTTL